MNDTFRGTTSARRIQYEKGLGEWELLEYQLPSVISGKKFREGNAKRQLQST